MSVAWRHVKHQGPVLAGIARVAVATLRSRGRKGGAFTTPGPLLVDEVPPLPADLVRDYIRHVGGNPAAWSDRQPPELPPHLFSQWTFPVLSRLLVDVPYDLSRVLNGGVNVRLHRPLPANEPLHVSARLQGIDDNGQRAVLHQVVTTGTASAPEALSVDFYAIVPLSSGHSDRRDAPPRDRPTVGVEAKELERWRLSAHAGLEFAALTGDFNPIHWIAPAGRAAGFGGCILHGFSTLARAWEGLTRGLYLGDIHAITGVNVRFVKPLRIPRDTALFVESRPDGEEPGRFTVGDFPGSPAFLTGTFSVRETPHE